MSIIKKIVWPLFVGLALAGSATAQNINPGTTLVLYDSIGEFGWIGGIHARMLGNLLGHFPLLPYEIMPVENYRSNDVNLARTTFYIGSVYQNPLPAAFKQDVLNTTNTVCWFRYNLSQIGGAAFESKTGLRFNWLDWSGYSNIVYKGETLLKNQLDAELGYVSVLDTNLARTPATANKADGTSIPYVTTGGNFWYVSDTPFEYISEEDRYLVFADLLHDIVGIDHATAKSAIIRLEDVAPTMYASDTLRATADLLHSNNVPFAIALVPVYTDPLGAYSSGVDETHHMADAADPLSVDFVDAIRYMVARGGQLIIHGYTHQYSNVANPYTGCSGDDFEFWRETFDTNSPGTETVDIYAPIPEETPDWTLGRLNAAKQELAEVGLSAVGFEAPHYAASALGYQVMATNFPLTMHRVLCFDDAGHMAGQFFPYVIHEDMYGQRIIPENIGNIGLTPWMGYPARSAADMIRAARKNQVVRDGWASGYFHPFLDLTNLQAVVEGVKAMGYTYLPVSASAGPSITAPPVHLTVRAGSNATFSVSAAGDGSLACQWRRNGGDLAGATTLTLVITNAQSANAGDYTVVISNAFGVVTSAVVTLTVQTPPSITAQLLSCTNAIGTTVTFSVTAIGDAPLGYQWRKNGGDLVDVGNISGTASPDLVLTNLQFGDAGCYSVMVSNAYGCVTSAPPATLTIPDLAPPALTIVSHADLQWLNETSITLSGTASDADRGDHGIAAVTVNGVRATNDLVNGADTAVWSKPLTLIPGTNTIMVVAGDGLGNATTNVIRLISDLTKPVVAISAPTASQRWSNTVFTVTGTAGDNGRVTNVSYQLNGKKWNLANTANAWSNWTVELTLIPGTNELAVFSADASGNHSSTSSVSLFFVVPSLLTLQINGVGTISPNYDGQLLEIGRSYTMTATPGTGYVFSNWAGGITTRSPQLTFLMQSNLTLQANFIPNPFIAARGIYIGLFYDTNEVVNESSGFFTATTTDKGAYNGSLSLAGSTYSISGQLEVDGMGSNGITRSGQSPLALRLQWDLAGGKTMTGIISDGTWTTELSANRATYQATTNPASQAGRYTLLLPGGADSLAQPAGDGYGILTISPAGQIQFSGRAGDNTALAQVTTLSDNGQWPFYQSLYQGRGSLLGWLTVGNQPDGDITGWVNWIKPAQASAYYPTGFVFQTGAVGSRYTAPAAGQRLLNFSTGQVWLAHGNLPQSFTNQIRLTTNNVVQNLGTNYLGLTLSASYGTFSGYVLNPMAARYILLKGVVLQKQNRGGGFFAGTNQTGQVYFGP